MINKILNYFGYVPKSQLDEANDEIGKLKKTLNEVLYNPNGETATMLKVSHQIRNDIERMLWL